MPIADNDNGLYIEFAVDAETAARMNPTRRKLGVDDGELLELAIEVLGHDGEIPAEPDDATVIRMELTPESREVLRQRAAEIGLDEKQTASLAIQEIVRMTWRMSTLSNVVGFSPC